MSALEEDPVFELVNDGNGKEDDASAERADDAERREATDTTE